MRKTGMLALGACLLSALVGFGQAPPAGQPPAAQPAAGPQQPGQRARMRRDWVEDRLERMSRRLNLTDEQKAKIRLILQDEAKQLRALRQDTSLSPDQQRQQAREIRTSARKQIDQILTPEQKEKRKEMWQKARKGRAPRGEQPPQQ